MTAHPLTTIRQDASPLLEVVELLSLLFVATFGVAPHLPPDLLEALVRFFDLEDEEGSIGGAATGRARQGRVTFYPSETALELLAALLAFNRESGRTIQLSVVHGGSSQETEA